MFKTIFLMALCFMPFLDARAQIGSDHEINAAKQSVAATQAERKRAERDFLAEQKICLGNFLAQSCVDRAQQKKNARLNELQKTELAARDFIRREEARLKELERNERNQKDLAEQEKNRVANQRAYQNKQPQNKASSTASDEKSNTQTSSTNARNRTSPPLVKSGQTKNSSATSRLETQQPNREVQTNNRVQYQLKQQEIAQAKERVMAKKRARVEKTQKEQTEQAEQKQRTNKP